MYTYTTCASCNQILAVTSDGHEMHEDCPPPAGLAGWKVHYVQAIIDGDDDAASYWQHLLDNVDAPRPGRQLQAALMYASWGWPVFPLRPGRKVPATAHGVNDATTEPRTVTAWWDNAPAANIGLATGHLFDVIDIDPPARGWWAQIRAEHHNTDGGPVGDIHGTVFTPRNGWHLYVAPSGEGNLASVRDGVDYRGRGGYVVAPPSTLAPETYAPDKQSGAIPLGPLSYMWAMYPSPTIKGAHP